MADIQLEHGHVRIANGYLEALMRAPIPGRHRRVLDAIVRLSWGWQRPVAPIASSRLAELTGISAGQARKIVRDLVRWQVVTRLAGSGTRPATLGPQKDPDAWEFPRPPSRPAEGPASRPAERPAAPTSGESKERQKDREPPAGPPAEELVRAWWERWYSSRCPGVPVRWDGADFERILALVKVYGRQRTAELMRAYFESDRIAADPWIVEKLGYSTLGLEHRAAGLALELEDRDQAAARQAHRDDLDRAADQVGQLGADVIDLTAELEKRAQKGQT